MEPTWEISAVGHSGEGSCSRPPSCCRWAAAGLDADRRSDAASPWRRVYTIQLYNYIRNIIRFCRCVTWKCKATSFSCDLYIFFLSIDIPERYQGRCCRSFLLCWTLFNSSVITLSLWRDITEVQRFHSKRVVALPGPKLSLQEAFFRKRETCRYKNTKAVFRDEGLVLNAPEFWFFKAQLHHAVTIKAFFKVFLGGVGLVLCYFLLCFLRIGPYRS